MNLAFHIFAGRQWRSCDLIQDGGNPLATLFRMRCSSDWSTWDSSLTIKLTSSLFSKLDHYRKLVCGDERGLESAAEDIKMNPTPKTCALNLEAVRSGSVKVVITAITALSVGGIEQAQFSLVLCSRGSTPWTHMFSVSNRCVSSQAGHRGFESRLPLHLFKKIEGMRTPGPHP